MSHLPIQTDDVLAGFYVKEDGRANPVDCTMSMAKGARMRTHRLSLLSRLISRRFTRGILALVSLFGV